MKGKMLLAVMVLVFAMLTTGCGIRLDFPDPCSHPPCYRVYAPYDEAEYQKALEAERKRLERQKEQEEKRRAREKAKRDAQREFYGGCGYYPCP